MPMIQLIKGIIRKAIPLRLYQLMASYWFEKRETKRIFAQFLEFSKASTKRRFSCDWRDSKPCISDATTNTGFDAHYLYHTAWAARRIAKYSPALHTDFSSCLRFNSIVSAFIPVQFYDIRKSSINLSGISCNYANLTKLDIPSQSLYSVSCMHVIEHIGLGRYGDQIDPEGDIKALHEIRRIVANNGHLLIAVPIGGTARIQFNAHRIYTFAMIRDEFSEFNLLDFSLVTDDGSFIENCPHQFSDQQKYGCGCFHFQRRG